MTDEEALYEYLVKHDIKSAQDVERESIVTFRPNKPSILNQLGELVFGGAAILLTVTIIVAAFAHFGWWALLIL